MSLEEDGVKKEEMVDPDQITVPAIKQDPMDGEPEPVDGEPAPVDGVPAPVDGVPAPTIKEEDGNMLFNVKVELKEADVN